jgi:hypothetical protein
MSTVEIKYLLTPHDGTPGKPWDDFEENLLNVAAGKTDDRGWSLADCLTLVDEGSAGGPAMPGGAAANKALIARRRRLKDSYSLLIVHELDADHKRHMKQNHFQDGPAAFAYMQAACRQAVNRLELRAMDHDWDDLDIMTHVGVTPNSIADISKKINGLDAKRPAANRKSQTEKGDKLLELIFSCSKHFSTDALTEYNAAPADWQYAIPAGAGVAAGQRDFAGITRAFHVLWKAAVDAKLPGFHVRAPSAKPAKATRTTLEAGLLASESGGDERANVGSEFHQEAGSDNLYVPRKVDPHRTLHLLADSGHELAARHGTTTTSDFGLLTEEECDACTDDGNELIQLFDENDIGSVELSCHNCGGLGHIGRVCPSPKKNRTLAFIIATLQAKQAKLGKEAPRRPANRGQRPPFRSVPRRFQPARRSDGQRVTQQRSRRSAYLSAEEGESVCDTESSVFSSHFDASGSSGSGSQTGSLASERLESVKEVSEPPAVKHPVQFSDDQLFQAERLRMATESPPISSSILPELSPIAIIVSITAVLASVIAATMQGIERARTLGGLVVVVIVLSLCGRVRSQPAVTLERLLPGREEGRIALGGSGLYATVDSGATSTAIPESRIGMVKRIIDESPNRKIWIADDKALDIVKVAEMDIEVPAFKLEPKEGVPPRSWNQTACTATIPSTRTLVVRGLGKDTILYSVRGLKRDGVKTFLNDDNSIQREDCLLLSDGLTVIPFANTYAYQISLPDESAAAATDITSRRSAKVPSLFHSALAHSGQRRLKSSNISMDGVLMSDLEHDPSTCPGCRLGNSGKYFTSHKRWAQAPSGSSRAGFTHFGQQIDTDICLGFQPSFPHLFTSMMNFNDRYSLEKSIYFMRSGESAEICSSLTNYHGSVRHRLREGVIGRWVTDNSKSFMSNQTEDVAADLVQRRGYSVPNDSDSLPVPERHWGVLERMMRSMHAGCVDTSDPNDKGAPECLWPWSAHQANLLLYYLSTASHDPPMSPYQFSSGDKSAVDLSWARVMFCDVTVSLPDRDIDGKISTRSADAVHLGYDKRRNCHYVFCESLQRLTSCVVREWREDSFILCKRISADTPVEYFEAHDLPFSDVTSQLIPHRHTARARRELGQQIRSGYRILILFHRERDFSVMAFLRDMGHSVQSRDIQDGCDLSLDTQQNRVTDSLYKFDFVFMCPPCTSASIAFEPPLRTFPSATRGVDGLTTKHQNLVDSHNTLFDFSSEVILQCDARRVDWCLESCASRRRKNKANWPLYHRNGFVWDYPPIERIFTSTTARTRCCAQCKFSSPWQKYTDLGSSSGANESFDNIFLGADCDCESHEVVLKGYDEHGVALTAVAAEYKPGFASAIAGAIDDTCRSGKEGEDGFASSLRNLTRQELNDEIGLSLLDTEDPKGAVSFGLTRTEIAELHSQAHRERTDVSPDMEIFLEDSEGGYMLIEESAFRVSEIGSELSNIKTVEQAQQSKFWPLFKAAMEEEIVGKLGNNAFRVVMRPLGITVHRSRWVFAIKLNDDNSIKLVKARFVGCGYSQVEGRDYDSVFAATLPGVSFRILCCCIADEDLDTDHIDAVKAFTQAGIDKQTFVECAEGFTVDDLPPSKSAYCLELLMALEGIKQGANLWFGLNKAAWLRLGCKSWMNEANLYHHEGLSLRVGVFADDTLAGFPSENRYQYLAMKKEYGKIIKIGSSDTISPVLKFTGVQIDRDRPKKIIMIHQTRYIEQMAASLKAEGLVLKQQDTPHGTSKEDRASFDKLIEDTSSPLIDKITFLKLMGKLVWPSCMTRPDISMEVSALCSCVSFARQKHYDFGLIVAGYLETNKSLGITYGGSIRVPYGMNKMPDNFVASGGLYTAHDSSWGTKPKPLGGYVTMYLNGAIDWSAKLVKIVPDSSCEAETAVASTACKGTCFVRGLLQFHKRPVASSTLMLGDNQAYHSLVSTEGASVRTRYYERATMLIKRAVLMLLVRPFLVATHYMIADMFTKALEKSSYIRFRNVIMNCNSSARSSLAAAALSLHGEARRMADRLLRQL